MDTAVLVQRCRQGDELAWESLVRQYQGRVFGIALSYVGDSDEARDLAQEIFIRIYRRLDSCRDDRRFGAWMIRLARNACLDHLRRRKVRPPARDIPADEMTGLRHAGPTPEENWISSSRQRLVHRALRQLSEINREIILLKDIQGLPLEEIAGLLELPLGTIKSRSSRARVTSPPVARPRAPSAETRST